MNKLPVGRLARHAYLDVLANQQGLLRVGGPWLLLSWALLLLAHSGLGRVQSGRRPFRSPSVRRRSRSLGTGISWRMRR